MIKGLLALFNAFKAGNELRSSAGWKNAQAIGSFLAAVVAAAAAFGYDPNILPEHIVGVAGFIAAIVNFTITLTTSKKVGLPNADAKPEPEAVEETKEPEPSRKGSVYVGPVTTRPQHHTNHLLPKPVDKPFDSSFNG